jgi:hypothetical protein
MAACLAAPLWAKPAVNTTMAGGTDRAPGAYSGAMPKQCQPGKTSTEALGWRFRSGTLVHVYYLKGNFTAKEAAALSRAVNNWNDALKEINSGILFRLSGESETLTKDGTSIVVVRGAPRGKERVGEIRLHSMQNGRAHLLVVVSPKVTEANALTSLMTHELGHTMGLADCYECRTGTTAMAAFRDYKGNDVYEPSECDKYVVANGYAGRNLMQARAASAEEK